MSTAVDISKSQWLKIELLSSPRKLPGDIKIFKLIVTQKNIYIYIHIYVYIYKNI